MPGLPYFGPEKSTNTQTHAQGSFFRFFGRAIVFPRRPGGPADPGGCAPAPPVGQKRGAARLEDHYLYLLDLIERQGLGEEGRLVYEAREVVFMAAGAIGCRADRPGPAGPGRGGAGEGVAADGGAVLVGLYFEAGARLAQHEGQVVVAHAQGPEGVGLAADGHFQGPGVEAGGELVGPGGVGLAEDGLFAAEVEGLDGEGDGGAVLEGESRIAQAGVVLVDGVEL